MNLALHQLRLEFRRSQIGLVLYFLILVCNYAVAAGWIGIPEVPNSRYWNVDSVLSPLFIVGYWAAFVVIVANTVLADSPARQDRFLQTRPLPTRSLVVAKALYILIAGVLPAALIEGASTATIGGAADLVFLAAFERFLFCGTLALAVAMFAVHWKNAQGLILAGVIGFAGVMILGRIIISLVRWLGALRDPLDGEPTYLTALQAFLVLALGLGLIAWISSRRGRKLRYLIPALAPVFLASMYVLTTSPFRIAPFRPGDQSRIDQLLANQIASAKVVPRGFQFEKTQHKSELQATYAFTPVTSGLPKDIEVRWRTIDSRWEVGGKIARRDRSDPNLLGDRLASHDRVPVSWALSDTIQDHLGSPIVFRLHNHSWFNTSSSLSTSPLEYLPEGPQVGQEARLETEVVGDAFTWKIAEDLALTQEDKGPGSDDGSVWKIAKILPSAQGLHILLSETAVTLHTGGNIRNRSGRVRWWNMYRFVLYLPAEKLALFGTPDNERAAMTVSTAKRIYGSIDFEREDHTALSPEELEGARLLILQDEYIGRIETGFTSPRFTLKNHSSHQGSSPSQYEDYEKLNAAEFALWFHRWRKLSPDQPAESVQSHLDELLDQVSRVDRSILSPREPAVIYAARFVPRHLDYLLERLPELPHQSSNFLIAAISQGAQEEQRQTIIEALIDENNLSAVIDERGWNRDAREVFITMTRDYLNSGSRFLHELLALEDPALDSIILDSYRASPRTEIYDLLRSIPRLAPEAERITDELWKPGRLVIARGRPQGFLQFALLQGKREALDELFATLRINPGIDHGASYELSSMISNTIQIPREAREPRHDPGQIIKWILQYNASDFVFDPLFRRFVLKTAKSTT